MKTLILLPETMKSFGKSCLMVAVLFCTVTLFGQTPIEKVNVTTIPAAGTASYNAAGANGSSLVSNAYHYKFGAATQTSYNLKDLNNFTLGSDVYSYSYAANSYVKIRRADNTLVSGNRSLLWLESLPDADPTKISIINPYKENMENVFDDNTFNAGTDNIFGNQGDGNGNNNNIERLDVIFPNGVKASMNNKCGFAVFERGADDMHDPFVIAPITAIDASGNPAAYGNIVRVAGNHYGNIPSTTTNYYIVRRDPATESNLRVSTSGTQNIGGVFLSFNDLGIANGVKIYGYSLFPVDLSSSATPDNLVDYSDSAFFPRNTSANTTLGGLDMLAITGIFGVPNAMIFPPTAYDVTMATITHAVTISPLVATAINTSIATYTIQTIPLASQGVLSVYVNGVLTPAVPGQVLTPAQIATMVFTPAAYFNGNVVFTYSATDNNNLSSNVANYTIPVVGGTPVVLPVNLLNFTGTVNKTSVQLNWQTSQEINSSYFEIQRSTDGKNYDLVATTTAKNNGTASTNDYTATDDLFFYNYSTVYYRIKLVDINGSYKYSPVITLKLGATTAASPVKVWPAPFVNNFTAEFNSESNENVTINIRSINGTVLVSSISLAKKGNNRIIINQAQTIPSGTYLLSISNSTKTETIKVVKI